MRKYNSITWLLLLFLNVHTFHMVDASIGSWRHWGAVSTTAISRIDPSSCRSSTKTRFTARVQPHRDDGVQWQKLQKALLAAGGSQNNDNENDSEGEALDNYDRDRRINGFVRFIGTITQGIISCGRVILPPTVALTQSIVGFYRALPRDAILAQIGLVYCFAGGYYPTLFSSLQAARHCGWDIMVLAIQDLTDEALKVIDATSNVQWDDLDRHKLFLRQTNIVLKTVDPMKINQAAGALYTTWLGVSAVLEKEYARVISLSMTLAYYMERVTHWILEPPIKLVVHRDYHRWVPVAIGWGCKAAAMSIAWRIQRVLTASTSAMTGGVMFARAILPMFQKRSGDDDGGVWWLMDVKDDETTVKQSKSSSRSPLVDIIGFSVAAIGFWTQMEVQYKNNFSFQVPFPFNLISWPFDLAEKWIQWVITKDVQD